jgi:hypothetical protein
MLELALVTLASGSGNDFSLEDRSCHTALEPRQRREIDVRFAPAAVGGIGSLRAERLGGLLRSPGSPGRE